MNSWFYFQPTRKYISTAKISLINSIPYLFDYKMEFFSFQNNSNKRAMMALGRSPEYHWNQIISKSVHRFSRSHFKLFSIYSPGGRFVEQSRTV